MKQLTYDVEGSLTAPDLRLMAHQQPGKTLVLRASTRHGLQEWLLVPIVPPHDVQVAYSDSPVVDLREEGA